MLYLNLDVSNKTFPNVPNLTLTSVVFELHFFPIITHLIFNLTLTSVVFEFFLQIQDDIKWYNLTLTSVVSKFYY